MAWVICASSGSTVRAEAGDDLAARRDEELLEVPADVAGVALGVGDRRQLLVDRVAGLAVDVDLLEQREVDAVASCCRTPGSPRPCPAPGRGTGCTGSRARRSPRSPYSSWIFCRPVYCGVSPHLDATLTMSRTSPLCSVEGRRLARDAVDRMVEEAHRADSRDGSGRASITCAGAEARAHAVDGRRERGPLGQPERPQLVGDGMVAQLEPGPARTAAHAGRPHRPGRAPQHAVEERVGVGGRLAAGHGQGPTPDRQGEDAAAALVQLARSASVALGDRRLGDELGEAPDRAARLARELAVHRQLVDVGAHALRPVVGADEEGDRHLVVLAEVVVAVVDERERAHGPARGQTAHLEPGRIDQPLRGDGRHEEGGGRDPRVAHLDGQGHGAALDLERVRRCCSHRPPPDSHPCGTGDRDWPGTPPRVRGRRARPQRRSGVRYVVFCTNFSWPRPGAGHRRSRSSRAGSSCSGCGGGPARRPGRGSWR